MMAVWTLSQIIFLYSMNLVLRKWYSLMFWMTQLTSYFRFIFLRFLVWFNYIARRRFTRVL